MEHNILLFWGEKVWNCILKGRAKWGSAPSNPSLRETKARGTGAQGQPVLHSKTTPQAHTWQSSVHIWRDSVCVRQSANEGTHTLDVGLLGQRNGRMCLYNNKVPQICSSIHLGQTGGCPGSVSKYSERWTRFAVPQTMCCPRNVYSPGRTCVETFGNTGTRKESHD